MTDQVVTEFSQFYYPEGKDLLLKFLTLVVSVLTVSMVFAEKFVLVLGSPFRRHAALLVTWALFFVAIVLGGLSLFHLFIAAEIAHGQIVFKYAGDIVARLRTVYRFADTAGACFAGGLFGLAFSAIDRLVHDMRGGRKDAASTQGRTNDRTDVPEESGAD